MPLVHPTTLVGQQSAEAAAAEDAQAIGGGTAKFQMVMATSALRQQTAAAAHEEVALIDAEIERVQQEQDKLGRFRAALLGQAQLAGEAAFITAILPGQGLPAPLLVGYVVTALASITLPIGIFVASRRRQDEEREKSKKIRTAPEEP